MFTLFTMCSDYEEDAGKKRILVGVGLTLRLLSVRTTVCTTVSISRFVSVLKPLWGT